MQKILCLDISQEPAQLNLVEVKENSIKVIEKKTFELDKEFYFDAYLTNNRGSGVFDSGAIDSRTIDSEAIDSGTETNSSEEATNNIGNDIKQGSVKIDLKLSQLAEALNSFENSWSNSVVVVPPNEHISLSVELPFSDDKSIEKVINLEVQDLVPFNLDDFLVQYSKIEEDSNKLYVNLVPKLAVKYLLKKLKVLTLEPEVVTTPSGSLGAALHLAPKYFSNNSAILYSSKLYNHLAIVINGKIVGEKSLTLVDDNEVNLKNLKICLTSFEKKFDTRLEKIYILGAEILASELQAKIGRPCANFTTSELIKESTDGVTSLASVFAKDIDPPKLITNFRAREFSYSPYLKNIIKGLLKIRWEALAALFLLLLLPLINYFFTSLNISKINSSISKNVKQYAEITGKKPLSLVADENAQLSRELSALGAPTSSSILNSFITVAKDIKKAKETSQINITNLRFKGDRISVEGTAPNYSDVSNFESVLNQEKKDKLYCKVSHDSKSGSKGAQRGFKFTIKLCD